MSLFHNEIASMLIRCNLNTLSAMHQLELVKWVESNAANKQLFETATNKEVIEYGYNMIADTDVSEKMEEIKSKLRFKDVLTY